MAIFFKCSINQHTNAFRKKKQEKVKLQRGEENQTLKGPALQAKIQIKEGDHRIASWLNLYSVAHDGKQ